jgi:RHS repeat-associated protein
VTTYRHYVYANGRAVAIYDRDTTSTNTWRYVLSDHEGSVSSFETSAGSLITNVSFAPFGWYRSGTTWTGVGPAVLNYTRRGFGFQNMLGTSSGLVHMKGRVEDSFTGRFISADPNIPDPLDPQSYNRYAYARNNPISRVDPTGFGDTDSGAAMLGDSLMTSVSSTLENLPLTTFHFNLDDVLDTQWDWAAFGAPTDCYGNCGRGSSHSGSPNHDQSEVGDRGTHAGTGTDQTGSQSSSPGTTGGGADGQAPAGADASPEGQAMPGEGGGVSSDGQTVTVTACGNCNDPTGTSLPSPALFSNGTSTFFAPAGTQYQALWQAGISFALKGGKASQIGQYLGTSSGMFNFQQISAAQGLGYSFYQSAANFGVGVFMDGYYNGSSLGYGLMTLGGQGYGAWVSSNWSLAQMVEWQQSWTEGWNAAQSGNWPVQLGTWPIPYLRSYPIPSVTLP